MASLWKVASPVGLFTAVSMFYLLALGAPLGFSVLSGILSLIPYGIVVAAYPTLRRRMSKGDRR
jgi:hypothetical protein